MSKADTSVAEMTALPYEMISLESMGAAQLFGEINQISALTTCEFILKANMLASPSTELSLIINSEGGNVTDGFAIIDIMQTSRLKIHTIGVGQLASMGLLISCAGFKGTRTISKNTEIMAHQFAGGAIGKFHELMAVTKEFSRLEQKFIQHFLKHSNMNEKQIRDIVFSPTDRYLTPIECKKLGLCDRVSEYIETPPPMAKKPVVKKPVAKRARSVKQ